MQISMPWTMVYVTFWYENTTKKFTNHLSTIIIKCFFYVRSLFALPSFRCTHSTTGFVISLQQCTSHILYDSCHKSHTCSFPTSDTESQSMAPSLESANAVEWVFSCGFRIESNNWVHCQMQQILTMNWGWFLPQITPNIHIFGFWHCLHAHKCIHG